MIGDGNCFYWVVFKVKIGSEFYYVFLWFLIVLELLGYCFYYDSDYWKYVDLISDNRVVSGVY